MRPSTWRGFTTIRTEAGRVVFRDVAPGEYLVSLFLASGFDTPEPVRVQVAEGVDQEVTVNLVRAN